MTKKKNIVTVTSVKDVVDIVNHNTSVFDRRTKKLAKGNRNLKVLCLMAIGYAIYAAVENLKQEEKVYQLSVRVQKLEQGEGE